MDASDTPDYSVAWWRNGVYFWGGPTGDYDISNADNLCGVDPVFSPGDEIHCDVFPNQIPIDPNSSANGIEATSPAVIIQNSTPNISNVTVTPSPATQNDTLTCDYDYFDFDGDADASTVEWSSNGQALNGFGQVAVSERTACAVTVHGKPFCWGEETFASDSSRLENASGRSSSA